MSDVVKVEVVDFSTGRGSRFLPDSLFVNTYVDVITLGQVLTPKALEYGVFIHVTYDPLREGYVVSWKPEFE